MIEHSMLLELGFELTGNTYALKPSGQWSRGLFRSRADYRVRLELTAHHDSWFGILDMHGKASLSYTADGKSFGDIMDQLAQWLDMTGPGKDLASRHGLELLKSLVSGIRLDLELTMEQHPALDAETLDGMRRKQYQVTRLAGSEPVPVRVVGWWRESVAPGVCRTFLRLEPEHSVGVWLETELPCAGLHEVTEEN